MTLSNTIFGAFSRVRKVSWGLVMQELVKKLVSELENWKPSPISFFHLYNRFGYLREGEASMLDFARIMLKCNVNPEAIVQLDTKGEDSE